MSSECLLPVTSYVAIFKFSILKFRFKLIRRFPSLIETLQVISLGGQKSREFESITKSRVCSKIVKRGLPAACPIKLIPSYFTAILP